MNEASNRSRFTPEDWHTVTPRIVVRDAGIRNSMPAFLYVYVDDTDETYRRALQAGASSLEEPSDMPYGDRRGMVKDEWGNTWQIATHLGDRDAA
jgi:uncharacterized glyoxalase superfamily protein PhnB